MIDVINANGVSFRYNGIAILDNIRFDVKKGDFLGIVGPNGSGKTTLIRLLLGLLTPSSGSIQLFGQPVSRFHAWHKIGYLPQKIINFNPHFPATVREIVAMGLLSGKKFPRRTGRRDSQAIDNAIKLLDITGIEDKLIGELSGGQQQRALIAKALVAVPELLILDEPTTALDPEGRERFFLTLKDLNQQKGVAVIIITHDIGTIGKHASLMLYLDKNIIFYGGFDDFCLSADMTDYFGEYSQHLICHRHEQPREIKIKE